MNFICFSENLSNVDDNLGELYLNEKSISKDDIEVFLNYLKIIVKVNFHIRKFLNMKKIYFKMCKRNRAFVK